MPRRSPRAASRNRSHRTALAPDVARRRRRIRAGGSTLVVYQVHYDARSERRVDPLFNPVRNPELGPFFESALIADLLAAGCARGADYFGVLSWKFRAKIPLAPRELVRRIARDRGAADVYTFFGRIAARHPWPLAERKHPGILRAATVLLRRLHLDVDLAGLEAPVIHQNHFLCRARLYERFGRELLAPALRAMSDPADRELQSLLRKDAVYADPRLTRARLLAIFGRPWVCLHPFVCERLFSTWLGLHPEVRVRHVWRGRFVEKANVAHEPEMRRAAPSS